MTNNFDLNKFNSFLDKATQAISCDSNCQKQRTEQELKDKYMNAQLKVSLVEPQLELAKKNYYTYISGENGYADMIENEFNEKADLIIQKFKDSYYDEIAKIKSKLDTYKGLLINFKNVLDLEKKYTTENKQLYKKLKEDTNDVLTNERKTYYEDQSIESLNTYYYYILLIIYIIAVLCLAIFSLVYPSQSNLIVKIILLVIFIILPFFSTWILGKLIFIIHSLFKLLPKNVYV